MTSGEYSSGDFDTYPPELIQTHQDFRQTPWIHAPNLVDAGFTRSSETFKYFLKDDPETIVRISEGIAFSSKIHDFLRNFAFAAGELDRLRKAYGVTVPEFEYRVVRHPTIALPLITRNGDYDLYVKTERIHGLPLLDLDINEPGVVEGIEEISSAMVAYYLDAYLANLENEGRALGDITAANQFMWGGTADKPEPKRFYMVDLALTVKNLAPGSFLHSAANELAEIYWSLIVAVEKKYGVELASAKQSLASAIELIGQHDSQMADRLSRAISLKDEDEFDEFAERVEEEIADAEQG